MSNHLNPLDPNALQIKTTEEVSPLFYEVYGSEISWVFTQPKNGTTFNDDVNSHWWTTLGIYSESDIQPFGTTVANGGFSDSMIGTIKNAYDGTGLLIGNIASSAFRTSFFQNVRLTIPITGGTGTLSGLTSLDLYSGFVNQTNSKELVGGGPCATWLVDSLYSESHPGSTHEARLGYAMDNVNNPSENTGGNYRSGIVHLFSEDIYFSGNTGTTWSTGWSNDNRYTFGESPLATFSGPKRNKAVGILQVDSGIFTLYDPDIVTLFNTAVATGGTITSGLTFPTSQCSMGARDRDQSTYLNINTTLTPETFTQSTNASLLDAKQAGIECDGQVNITQICFYNEVGQLTATGSFDTPVIKRTEDYISTTCQVTLDGGTKYPPYFDSDGVLNGRTTF